MNDGTVVQRTEYPDSIELGRLGKGGIIKVYFNADDINGTKFRIDNAVEARSYLITKLAEKGVRFDV